VTCASTALRATIDLSPIMMRNKNNGAEGRFEAFIQKRRSKIQDGGPEGHERGREEGLPGMGTSTCHWRCLVAFRAVANSIVQIKGANRSKGPQGAGLCDLGNLGFDNFRMLAE
jgi:hypothetical protein